MSCEERHVVERARAGDLDALDLIYHRYYPRVLRFGMSMLRCSAAAEDIAQDVFSELPAHLARFDPERAALGSYLFGVVRNLARRRRRQDDRTRPLEHDDVETFPAQQLDPRAQLERREHRAIVRRVVNTLPERMRAPLLLCDLHDVPYADAAARLGTTPAALRHRLRAGRGWVRRALDKTLPTESRARGNHDHDAASIPTGRVPRQRRTL